MEHERMEKKTYADRFKVHCSREYLESFGNEDGPWSEDEEDIAQGLAWGKEKALLLKWVRKQIRRRLSAPQRRCIELYYFKDMTYAEIGKKIGCAPSTACRNVQRGIKRLQTAARVDPPAHLKPKRHRSVKRASER
jgi:RNA polymerase sigma factor (sigma-70 family)